MSQHHALQRQTVALGLLLALGALLMGAALGHLLLPPGRLGWGSELDVGIVQVQAVAAAARASSPTSPDEQIRSALLGSGPFQRSKRSRTGTPTGESQNLPARPSLSRTHDWRLELQGSQSWQYAAGTDSRNLRAPDSLPSGEPR